MNKFIINNKVITITQFLKANNYISSGGEAKFFLREKAVLINGVRCELRGKKLYANDIVKIDKDEYLLKDD